MMKAGEPNEQQAGSDSSVRVSGESVCLCAIVRLSLCVCALCEGATRVVFGLLALFDDVRLAAASFASARQAGAAALESS